MNIIKQGKQGVDGNTVDSGQHFIIIAERQIDDVEEIDDRAGVRTA